ncbi:MAG: hypothetical protein ACREOW_07615 [Thermodesulfobacteriota bacterium]
MKGYIRAMPAFVDNEEIEVLVQRRNDLRGKVHGWTVGIEELEKERAVLLGKLGAREQALRTHTVTQTMTRNLLDTPEALEHLKRIEQIRRQEREDLANNWRGKIEEAKQKLAEWDSNRGVELERLKAEKEKYIEELRELENMLDGVFMIEYRKV